MTAIDGLDKDTLKNIITSLPVSIAIFDRDLKYLAVSEKWLSDHNKQRENVIGKTLLEVSPFLDKKQIADLNQFLNTGESASGEQARVDYPDGSVKYLNWTVQPVRKDNNIDGLIITTEDVTQKVVALEMAAKSENLLTQAQKVAKVGSWSFDMVTQSIHWTKQMYSIFPEEIENGEPAFERHRSTIHPEDLEHWQTTVEKCFADGKPYKMTFRTVHPDKVVWVEAHGQGILDQEGNVTGLFGTCQDISDRIELEDKKNEIEMGLKLALESSGIGYWNWDIVNNVNYWNDNMYRLYGFAPDCGINVFEIWGQCLAEEDKEECQTYLQEFLQSNLLDYEEGFRINTPDGFFRHIVGTAKLIRDKNGAPVRMYGLNRDVTQQVEYENILTEAKENAIKASKAKSQFLANMSHEIRTPMNGLLGMLELMEATELNEEQSDYIGTALVAGESLLRILNDILDLSKIEAEKFEIDPENFDLKDAITDLTKIYNTVSAKQGLEFTTSMTKNIPYDLIGDKQRINQILNNFLSNSFKFTESGSVKLSVECVDNDGHSARLLFKVSDTGIGIDDELKKTLFQSFVQGDSSISKKYGGTGLGLTISAKLAQLMGGEIHVESQKGKGSTFSLSLPLDIQDSFKVKHTG